MTSRDVGRVGQQHHEPVDADAAAAGRGHAVLERANVVRVVVHRFLVAGFLRGDLGAKARRLVLGVVQLGKTVGDLATGDEQLEALGHARARIGLAGQRRDLDGIVDDVGRLPQQRLRGLLE